MFLVVWEGRVGVGDEQLVVGDLAYLDPGDALELPGVIDGGLALALCFPGQSNTG